MMLILCLHLSMIMFFDLPPFRQPAAFAMLTCLLILYTPCSILFSSALSYLFNKAETAQSILLNCASFVGVLPFGVVVLLDLIKAGKYFFFIIFQVDELIDF